MFDSPEIECAIAAVRQAALLARAVQQELVTPALTKDDRSPVTVGDFAVQAVVAQRIAERLPGAVLIGEESAEALQLEEGLVTLERVTHFVRRAVADATPETVCELIDRGSGQPTAEFWTLDPIDGTKGFLRRDQYAVALGKIEQGKVTIGVLGCPELSESSKPVPSGAGSLLVAIRGQGTWWQPLCVEGNGGGGEWQRLRVSNRAAAADARLLRSVEKSHTNTDEISRLAETLGITAATVPLDSQAKYAVLAAGAGDVLLRLISPKHPNYKEKIWDQAAGSLVITEAGGRITDLDGNSLDFSHGRQLETNRGILATNGPLHDALLAGLRSIKA